MSDNVRINFWVPEGSSFEEMPDGSLVVHHVPIMCEGSWTSMEGKTVKFGPEDLKANCANWEDNGIWTRHPLMQGENRPSDLCVGGVQNPAYVESFQTQLEDGTLFKGAAVLGDLVFHRQTDASKDAAVQIRLPKEAGGFRMTSAELIMQASQFDAANNVYRPTKYAFGGLTIQRKGGCAACNIPAFASATPGQGIDMAEPEKPGPAPPTPGGAEAMPAWAQELSGKLDKILAIAQGGAPQGGVAACPPQGMAAPAPETVAFAAAEKELAELKEKNRVLQASLDKELSKPAIAGNFTAEPQLDTQAAPTNIFVRDGKNMHLRRGL